MMISKIEPQPPKGIKYMLGAESWLQPHLRTPRRLVCEEWGNLGPLELNPDIKDNGHGFRVRLTEIPAPDGATEYECVDGVYFWTANMEQARKDAEWKARQVVAKAATV